MQLAEYVRAFILPEYHEIPDVGLYLEQTTKYVNGYFINFPELTLTGSMVSNYVKKKLIPNPVKRQYGREQIAGLFYIALAKNVLSIDNIKLTFELQKNTYDMETAYEYLRQEFVNVLLFTFGVQEKLLNIGKEETEQKAVLRRTLTTIANKLYLDAYFETLPR